MGGLKKFIISLCKYIIKRMSPSIIREEEIEIEEEKNQSENDDWICFINFKDE